MIEDDDMEQAATYPSLGPAYFRARRVCERAMEGFEDQHMKPLVDAIGKQIVDELWTSVQASLWSDIEMNLHGEMWTTVDDIVKALLSGKGWALQRYSLGSRYDHEAVRAAIAGHIPREIMDARISDLEAEVASLKEQIEWLRR